MKTILVLCLTVLLLPGIMAGCSQQEQSVQEQPMQEASNVVVAEPLRDMVTEVSDQAQTTAEAVQTTAEETVQVLETKAADVVGDLKEQWQNMSPLTESLTKDEAASIPSEATLTEIVEEVVPVPEIPEQEIVETAVEQVEEAAGEGMDQITESLDSALSELGTNVEPSATDVSGSFAGDGAAMAEGGVAVTEEVLDVTESLEPVGEEATEIQEDLTALVGEQVPVSE